MGVGDVVPGGVGTYVVTTERCNQYYERCY